MDQSGRNPLRLSFPGKGIEILDVSADGSHLLVVDTDAPSRDFPLWVVPTDGRSPRRLADLHGSVAAWSPDGQRLAYATGRELFLANADGTGSRKLIPLPTAGMVLRGRLTGNASGFVSANGPFGRASGRPPRIAGLSADSFLDGPPFGTTANYLATGRHVGTSSSFARYMEVGLDYGQFPKDMACLTGGHGVRSR